MTIEYLQNIFSPQLENEARQALKHFLTPSKSQLSESEQVSLAEATSFSIEVSEAFRYLFEEQFSRDVWQRLAVDRNAQNLKIPVLLFHDRRDREVVFDDSLTVSQVWSNARHNTFILLLKNQ